jgi:hypothetical protein
MVALETLYATCYAMCLVVCLNEQCQCKESKKRWITLYRVELSFTFATQPRYESADLQ